MMPAAICWHSRLVRRRLADYLALAKPRVVLMVLVTTTVGYVLGSAAPPAFLPLGRLLVGTALAAAGTLALNQWMERDLDARMARTRHRPLPEGRLLPAEAFALGAALLAAGVAVLALSANGLSAEVTGAIAVLYLLVYTPLKRVTPFNTIIGAIPGALPPLMGWTAARGELTAGGWALFAILFFWQLPHFLAIAWIYRDEYAKAGYEIGRAHV